MHPITTFAVMVGLVAFTTVLGLIWRSRTGRVRVAKRMPVVDIAELAPNGVAGRTATLLQFSTTVCSPCTTTHAILEHLASELPGVTHIDLDVTHRGDLANRFALLQSPTTLILDSEGRVRGRVGGAARREDVRAHLDGILTESLIRR